MKVCAMIDRSAGNESVGEMWTETAEFDESATLEQVIKWAGESKGFSFQLNVRLAILQDPAKGKPQ